MIGFKAFNKDLTCMGFQYAIGKTYELDCEPIPCKQGFHFCESIVDTYNYYEMSDDTRICIVEAIGDIKTDDNKKYCTNKIVICEEITNDGIRKGNSNSSSIGFCNIGNGNSGDYNSGDYNSGSYNTGNRNTGNKNTGKWNSGDKNTGNENSGDRNTGYYNTGNKNTGRYNSGNRNSGSYNSGYKNSGCYNSGDRNSGNYNSGNFNTGDFNLSDCNSGFFNTQENTIMFFDKPSDWTYNKWVDSDARRILYRIQLKTNWIYEKDMTDDEKENNPTYKIKGGYIKKLNKEDVIKEWWDELTDEEKEIIYELPNFDMEKFKKCVGLIL